MTEKRISRVAFILILLWPPGVVAGGDLDFKGLMIGSTPAQMQAKYPEMGCNDPKEMAKKAEKETRFSAETRSFFKQFWKNKQIEADIFCGHVISEGDPTTELTEIVGHRATAYDFTYFDRQLQHAYAVLSSDAFSDISSALTSKYGPPTETENVTVQNKMGAKFESLILRWISNGATVFVEKFYENLDDSRYGITSDTYWSEVESRRNARAKSKADSL